MERPDLERLKNIGTEKSHYASETIKRVTLYALDLERRLGIATTALDDCKHALADTLGYLGATEGKRCALLSIQGAEDTLAQLGGE